jgi:hypothetical protein
MNVRLLVGHFTVEWIDGGREPQNPPDPRYPDGIDLNIAGNNPVRCTVELPYPARRCGQYVVECTKCKFIGMITTAGRKDDPRSVTVACRKFGRQQ